MLHSRVLRYIDEVARLGSIRAAGDRLNVAPSAINKHILQLEETIGEPLFERLPRGLRLTPAGEILVAHIRRTMKEYSQVEAEIRDIKGLESGAVIVATTNGLAEGIVAKTAAGFCARHPRIKLSIRNMPIRDIVKSPMERPISALHSTFRRRPSSKRSSGWKRASARSFRAIIRWPALR
jgi:DNA-binding transcriptional LysR family regulator